MRSPGTAWQTASIALVILSVVLQWYSHSGGLLTTSDSCNYLSAANSFSHNLTFVSYDGEPYTYWPPLFPIILSTAEEAWYWIQMILTAWIGTLVVIETRRLITDPLLQTICQASILLGIHLLLIGVFLWSELLFLLILFHFAKALEKNFIAAIILGFFLCLQRNAGLFFVIGASLWYWDLKRSTILFVLSTSGFWVWNIYVTVARDYTYFQSIVHNFNLMSTAFMHALAPLPGIILLAVIGLLIYVLKGDATNAPVRLWSLLITIYFVGLLALFPIDVHDTDRFASVTMPFFLILVFRAIEIAAAKQTSRLRTVLIIAVVCWMTYPLVRTLKNAQQWHKLSFTSYFCAIQN